MLGSIKKTLFGSDPKVKGVSTLTGAQRRLLNQFLIPMLQEDFGNQPTFDEDLFGDVSDEEREVLQRIQQMLGEEGGGLSESGRSALERLLSGEPTDFDDYFQSAIFDPMMRQFELDILPMLSRQFAGERFGSERAMATGRAGGDLASTLAGTRGQLAFQTQESALDRMLKAIGLDMEATGQGFGQQLAGLEALGLERRVGDQQAAGRYTEFMRQQDERHRRIQEMLGAAGVGAKENIVFGGTSGLLQEFLSGAAEAGGRGLGTFLGGKF